VKGATDLAIMLALLSAVSCAAFTLGERAGDATSAEAEEDA
jgi:hypothetical protein